MENSKRIQRLVLVATTLFATLFAFGNRDSTDSPLARRNLQGISDLQDPRTVEIKLTERSLAEEERSPPALPVEGTEKPDSVETAEAEEKPREKSNSAALPGTEQKLNPDEGEKPEPSTSVEEASDTSSIMPFNLPKSAEDWCAPPKPPPLNYDYCKDNRKNIEVVNSIPMLGGLTNSLKILLLGAILSYEQGRCFFVDETTSALPLRKDPANLFPTTFLDRYFERIGLPLDDPIVEEAKTGGNIKAMDWREPWDWEHNRRIMRQSFTIPALGFTDIPGHGLKRNVLKRMWRPLPHVRETGCKKLEKHVGPEDFMSFSVRRGDKHSVEHFEYATVDQYLLAAEAAKDKHFGGNMPIIFVATDDCSVMPEFREKRPDWRFVSECDDEIKKDDGFRLTDMADWNHDETDAHFGKFFVELYALATSKYFIGVIYTNVTWWALFMRSQPLDTFQILKTPGTENREGIDEW